MLRKFWCWIVGVGCGWQPEFETKIVNGADVTTKIQWIDRCIVCGAIRKREVQL
jgi:hypothetical protein